MNQQLRDNVANVLSSVTSENAPAVFNKIQSTEGYAQIEQMILDMAINEQISLSATIPYIEKMV